MTAPTADRQPMTIEVPRLLVGYARAMRVGGMALAAIVLATDHRWLEKPAACLILLGAVLVVRAAPVRLSKYSYLTQTGMPVLAGAITVGPTPVVSRWPWACSPATPLAQEARRVGADQRRPRDHRLRRRIRGVRRRAAGEREPGAVARFPSGRLQRWPRCTSSPAARSSTSRSCCAQARAAWSSC